MIEDDIATHRINSLQDLTDDTKTLQEETIDEDDDKEESNPILTNSQALIAVNDLRRYLSSFSDNAGEIQKINYVKSIIIANI